MLFDELYDFNQEWAKTHTKQQFVDEFTAYDHIFPDMKKAEKIYRLEGVWKTLRNEPDETPTTEIMLSGEVVGTDKKK